MSTFRKDKVHALEFGCQAPLRFYEHCSACPRFGAGCPDLELGKEILRGKKRIVYGQVTSVDEVPLGSFKCLAPLYYFEKTRSACPHLGRCREEGLLLALLSGKRKLDCSPAEVIPLAARRVKKPAVPVEKVAEKTRA